MKGTMNRITRIEKQSARSKRYQIEVDGEPFCSVHEDVLVRFRLHKGMEMDRHQLEEILAAEEYNKVRMAALRFLSYKPRTACELRQQLERKDFSAKMICQVIAEMEKSGYLDDRQFARQWVNERMHGKGYGSRRLKQELMRKGIDLSLIDEALTEVDQDKERQLAMQVAERRYLRIGREPWPTVERRLGQYLLRQGYSMGVVRSVLNQLRTRYEEEKEHW
jgi:regulatory protein